MRAIGLLLVAALIAAPLVEFLPLAAQHTPSAVFSQYIGCAALIAMAIAQIVATRIWIIEPIFGGLDRVYVLHKWLGIGALLAVLVHDTVDAEIDGVGRETWLTDLAETLGEISLYGFLILVLITIVTFIPYHLWRWSHKLMGAFFALSAFHFAFIMKPFANTDPVGMYVLGICGIGIVAYIYALLPDTFAKASNSYTVENIENTGDSLAVNLKPVGRGIRHHAGQFAFLTFDLPHLKEVHPFTVSAKPDGDRNLQFTIKPLGDYTAKLQEHLKPSVAAKVSSAFGHFRLRRSSKSQVWIASGIGITPFKAWLEEVTPDHGKIDLFYCYRGANSAPHLEYIEELAGKLNNVTLHAIDSLTGPRLSASKIKESVGDSLSGTQIFFCGPEVMRETLLRDLKALGISNRQFHFEEFEIRSGIGVRKFLSFVIKRFSSKNLSPDLLARSG
jgi:predicted ferric reductase